jgi:hypothetical protein
VTVTRLPISREFNESHQIKREKNILFTLHETTFFVLTKNETHPSIILRERRKVKGLSVTNGMLLPSLKNSIS